MDALLVSPDRFAQLELLLLLIHRILTEPTHRHAEGIFFAGPEAAHGASANVATGKNAAAILAAFEATYDQSLLPGRTRTTGPRCCSALSTRWRLRRYVDRAALREEIAATAIRPRRRALGPDNGRPRNRILITDKPTIPVSKEKPRYT